MQDHRILERPGALPDRRQGAAITWNRQDYDLTGVPLVSILDDLRDSRDAARLARYNSARDLLVALVAISMLLGPVLWGVFS